MENLRGKMLSIIISAINGVSFSFAKIIITIGGKTHSHTNNLDIFATLSIMKVENFSTNT